MTDYTKLPRNIADCMARAGAPLREDQRMVLAGYLAPVQQQLEQAKAEFEKTKAAMAQMALVVRGSLIIANEALDNETRKECRNFWLGRRSGMRDAELLLKTAFAETTTDTSEPERESPNGASYTPAMRTVKNLKHCSYPECRCPYQPAQQFQCLRGLPERNDENPAAL